MPTSIFRSFHKAFPPVGERVAYEPGRHDPVAAKVPPSLAAEWRSFGFGAYGGGLVWTSVPDQPFLDPADWPALDGTGIEVLRTAFADVYVWQGGTFLLQSVHSGKVTECASDPEILFDALTEKEFRRGFLLERLFGLARNRYGDLNRDECFGFAPLPALGGAIAEEYLIKSPMREYVAMAAQVLR
jgi:hypothetical protein